MLATRLKAAAAGNKEYRVLAVAHAANPEITVYPWDSATGFGTKYSNPGISIPGDGQKVSFNPRKSRIGVAHTTTPYITMYVWSGAGFGAKLTDPGTLPTGNATSVLLTASYNFVTHSTSPYITAYTAADITVGSKLANPATLPGGTAYDVAFTGSNVVVAHEVTPYVSSYPFSGAGFGTKAADPGTLPSGDAFRLAFNSLNNRLAVAHAGAVGVSAYVYSSGLAGKFTDPASPPSGGSACTAVAFSKNDAHLAVCGFASPYIKVYAWNNTTGFGSAVSDPATLPTGIPFDVVFSPENDAIAVAHDVSPYITVYPWTGSSFGTKYANPATLPTGVAGGVTFA